LRHLPISPERIRRRNLGFSPAEWGTNWKEEG
jgi:hypothetical protein